MRWTDGTTASWTAPANSAATGLSSRSCSRTAHGPGRLRPKARARSRPIVRARVSQSPACRQNECMHPRLLLLAILSLAGSAACAADASCPRSGLHDLVERGRDLYLGELHGTVEVPALVRCLVV